MAVLLVLCGGATGARAEASGEVLLTPPWWAKGAALSIDGRPAGSLPQKILCPPAIMSWCCSRGERSCR